MKPFFNFILIALVCSSTAFYWFYIDAPERWITPGAVEMSDEGIVITLTNISEETATIKKLGLAWQVEDLKHHVLLFEDQPREIPPGKTYTETHTLQELGSHLWAILSAEKHKLTLDLHVGGTRKGGVRKFSRLPVTLHDQRTSN